MHTRVIVPTILVLLATFAVPGGARAQAPSPAVNISAVARGGVVIVSYDLISSDSSTEFAVALEASTDGGRTYDVHPRTLKGDVGPTVRAGIGKQITWEAARDVENLEVDRYRYRVTAQPVRNQVSMSQASQPRPSPPGAVAPVRRGSGARWGGIALMGAGGSLAVLGTTTLKKEDYYTNKPLVWAGIAAAAGGVALLTIGAGRESVGTLVTVRPGGILVQHRLRLP